jgi:uncharacterized protein YndB with AHSA1/START domain
MPIDPSLMLERSVLIAAPRDVVFRYFTDSRRFAAWWGEGSQIDPKPGGLVKIVYPNRAIASGVVVELNAPERIVFTYGYEDPSKPIPPGGSRVTISLQSVADGTVVCLKHDLLPDAATRDNHVPGWRFQLSLFANVVANEQHAGVAARIDAWYAAWNGGAGLAESSVTADISVRDAYACVSGIAELAQHIAASRMHMPLTLARAGEPRQCQGMALCDWTASTADGVVRARGTNVFELAHDGRIRRVTGFWL